MGLIFGFIAVALLFSGGALAKNKVQDEVVAASDSFTKWDSLFQMYGRLYGVEWTMLKAIAMNESSLGDAPSVAQGLAAPSDVDGSKSDDGKSWGLMQLTLPTAGDYDPAVTPQRLNNPEYSVEIAAHFISDLLGMFTPSDPRYTEWVVKSYNQGAGNTKKEIAGKIDGYADEYWDRYQRNRAIIQSKQGE